MLKPMRTFLPLVLLFTLSVAWGAAAASPPEKEPGLIEFALAIHGGAGVIPKTMPEQRKEQYVATLRQALARGRDLLDGGASSIDVVEQVIHILEDSPLFNAGKGAVFTHGGTHELDAAIMDGGTLNCGSVSGVTTVKNPITLARRVMENSRHVFLIGEGAEQFAGDMGLERVDPEYFFVQRRYDQWQAALAREKEAQEEESDAETDSEDKHGTVGVAALDRAGNLAAGTSTGGLTNKRFGRVGDVPVIGAGTYANNRTAAISCTGFGEQFIRNTVAHDVSALMEYRGLSLEEAATIVIHQKLEPGDGGLIAVAHDGSIALVFNSKGMFRGAADSTGRFEARIWATQPTPSSRPGSG